MADERLRAEERRWRAQGGRPSARYLRERLRVGALTPGQLLLAAHLGDDAARAVLGSSAPEPVADLEDWIDRLRPWDPQAGARAAAACLAAALAAGSPGAFPDWAAPLAEEAQAAAAAWVGCPCLEHAEAAQVVSAEAYETYSAHSFRLPGEVAGPAPEPRPNEAAGALLAEAAWRVAEAAEATLRGASPSTSARHTARVVRSLLTELDRPAPAAAVREAVRRELTPWALGREVASRA